MRILVVGAGAVGGYFGGLLAKAGQEVYFIARGHHLEMLRTKGLKILDEVAVALPVQASERPPPGWVPDLCIFTVKNYDLANACILAALCVDNKTVFLTLQNGISAVASVQEYFPYNPVLAGLTYTNLELVEPGVIRKHGNRAEIRFGFCGSGPHLAQDVEILMRKAQIDAHAVDAIKPELWKKFTFISALSGITCALKLTIGTIRQKPVYCKMLGAAFQEAVDVAHSHVPGLPDDLYNQHFQTAMGLPDSSSSSMLKDLLANKPLELPWLSGEIVRLGKTSGIPTPTHEKLIELINTPAC